MRAAIIVEPGTVSVEDVPIPEPGPNQIQIEVKASGICGTDIHIYRGDYVGEYPVIPGHEFSGIVTEIGSGITRFKKGDRVAVEPNIACDNCPACLENRQNFCENWRAVGVLEPGAMAEYAIAEEKTVFPIGDMCFETGAFMEPLSCVLHGVERCSIRLSDRVLVFGAGPIGNLLIQSIRARGAAHLDVLERNRSRLQLALDSGADQGYESFAGLKNDYYDVVVDASGVPAVMDRSIDFVRYGGRILLFGVPPQEGQLNIPAFPVFRKGLSIFSSFTSVRNSLQAIRMLQSQTIDVSNLVSHVQPLEKFAESMEMIERGEKGVLKIQIKP